VPPAVTSTSARRGPPGTCEGGAEPTRCGDDVGGVGQAPGADVAAGEATLLGRDDVHAATAQVARLSCTAGCSHISVCIAGQTTTGARVASSVAVSRSSEMPAA
jgi:hypothetical protein